MKYLILILFLVSSCGTGEIASINLNQQAPSGFKYRLGELVYVRVNMNTLCRGYVADLFSTSFNHYKISPLICNGKQFYDLWVPEYDISR